MVVNYSRCTMWCWKNWSMVEYVAGSSDLWRIEGRLISHSVVTICGVSLHLWFMIPTWAWEKETLITHIPPFFVICSNSYTRILDRCLPSSATMTLKVIEGIWYDISRTNKNISSMKVSTTRDITLMLWVYDLTTSFNRRSVSWAATVMLPIEHRV